MVNPTRFPHHPPSPYPPTEALLPSNVTLLQPATRYFRLNQVLDRHGNQIGTIGAQLAAIPPDIAATLTSLQNQITALTARVTALEQRLAAFGIP